MSRVLRALDHFLTWLALWFIGVIVVYLGYALASSSRHLDAFEYLPFGALLTIAIIIDGGLASWLTAFFFLFGPPLCAWATYRAIRWLAGY
jgi:hypothetical protein